MANKTYTTQQQLLSNKHLKEWNDIVTAETAALYQLRCKHRIQRDQLAFEKITDTEQHVILVAQQLKEVNELKQQNSEKRVAIRQHHLKEQEALQQNLADIATYYRTRVEPATH